MVEVYAISIINCLNSDNEIQTLLRKLPERAAKKINLIKNKDDIKRSLLGEYLTRSILSKRTGLSIEAIRISYSNKGKPFLEHYPDQDFNISHSGDWVVVAVSSKEIGIDVEKTREPQYRIAERYFSESELSDLEILAGQEKIDYFFDLWTLKESFLKLLGKGLTRSLGSFSIGKAHDRFILLEGNDTGKEVFFYQYDLAPGYKLSVCSESNSSAKEIQFITINDLIGNL